MGIEFLLLSTFPWPKLASIPISPEICCDTGIFLGKYLVLSANSQNGFRHRRSADLQMAVIIVTVVPESSCPEITLSVKIRDRHDFSTLCENVRWQLKADAVRYPPGIPLEFVFFDKKRNALRIANDQQLSRALSLCPRQLHNGRLILFVYERSVSTKEVLPVEASDIEPPPKAVPELLTESETPLTPAFSFETGNLEEAVEGLSLSIGKRPIEINAMVWEALNQIASGQIASFPQLALTLSTIANISEDTEYPALQYCLRTMTPSQHRAFFQALLPLIGRTALTHPILKRTLRQGGDEMRLSRLQASSIVANIFLCSLANSPDSSLRRLTMLGLFRSDPFPAVTKIDAILHYLSSLPAHHSKPASIHIRRIHRQMSSWAMAHLQQCPQTTTISVDRTDLRSSPAQVHLEQVQSGHLAAAALGPECTADILRLFEAPELLAACALCEPLLRYDSIVISGARRSVCLSGEGARIRIKTIYTDDNRTTVVLFKTSFDHCDRFHPRALLDEILQVMAAMLATDALIVATNSGEMRSPHRIDLDRDFFVKTIAAMVAKREMMFYMEGDGRMAAYPSIAAMMTGCRAADLVRFLNGYRPSMGPLWIRLQEFLRFDQSVIKAH